MSMTDDNQPLLEISNLTKSYSAEEGGFLAGLLGGGGERIPALNGVSFSLQAGEVLGLTGESGSGKTVLARLICGLEKPDRGKVVFMGKTISTMSEGELKTVQSQLRYLAEDAFVGLSNDPKNRVDRLLSDPLTLRGGGSAGGVKGSVSEILQRVGLNEDYLERFPNQLSGGERQRLAIARALLLRPRLIVADEPVSNLDITTRTQMLNLMKRLGREFGTAFIFISHNPSTVRYFALNGRIAVMFAGRIMEIVPGQALFDRATHPYTKSLLEVNPAPSPLPGNALDPGLAFQEQERVEANDIPLDSLEAQLSADGNIAASAQLAAANRPGCPFYRWCPEHFERCQLETPQLLTVTRRRVGDEVGPLPPVEVETEHRAACLWYIEQ